jgi:phage baseplate assembly protein gpV
MPGGWGMWGGGNMPGGGRNEQGSTAATTSDTTSAKALKAAVSLTVSGGIISIDSSDDAIHTNGDLTISGGSIYISSGDDGTHADNSLTISGGDIDIVKSYEGIEALTINIAGGDIYIISTDDGVNAAGGSDSSSMGGRPGQNGFSSSGSGKLNITGGNLLINASGDGIDANGSISMTAGKVVIYGPTLNNNGAIDFDGGFTMSGGTLLAVGSSGMLQKPNGNGIKVLCVNTSIAADTLVCIADSSGNAAACFYTVKNIASIVYCAPELKSGTYTIYTGGSYSTGKPDSGGLLSGGEYTQGSKLATVKVS